MVDSVQNGKGIPQLRSTGEVLLHVEHINAIMIAIKPSLWQYYFVKITKEAVKEYFKTIRE